MLSKNALLEEIVERLSTHRVAETVVVEEYRKTKTRTHQESLHGLLGEIHMRQALREICRDYQDRVQFHPIPYGTETTTYRFRRSFSGTLAIFRRNNKRQHGELDELIVVDELPVVFESKLHRSPERTMPRISARDQRSMVSRSRYEAMYPQKIDRLLAPLREYFHRQQFGYAVIVYPSQMQSPHPIQREFQRQGGIVVPFPLDWYEHREETRELARRFQL